MTLSRLAAVGLISLILCFIPASCHAADPSSAVSSLTCVGDSQILFLSNQMPYVQARLGGKVGWFVVDTGTNRSGYSKKWFGETNPIGSRVPHDTFQFFERQQGVVFRVDEYDHDTGDISQAGMVGTDILARHPTTFDYNMGLIYNARNGFCDDASLKRAGLYPVPIKTNENMTYDAAPNGKRNVPMIEIEVNGVRIESQLDTGLSDGWSKSNTLNLSVNEAFVKKMVEMGYTLEYYGPEAHLTTCKVGSVDSLRNFRFAEGAVVSIIDTRGLRHSVKDVKFRLKRGTKDCGGLNSWEAPSAQMGISWFDSWGVFALDPVTKRFWVPEM